MSWEIKYVQSIRELKDASFEITSISVIVLSIIEIKTLISDPILSLYLLIWTLISVIYFVHRMIRYPKKKAEQQLEDTLPTSDEITDVSLKNSFRAALWGDPGGAVEPLNLDVEPVAPYLGRFLGYLCSSVILYGISLFITSILIFFGLDNVTGTPLVAGFKEFILILNATVGSTILEILNLSFQSLPTKDLIVMIVLASLPSLPIFSALQNLEAGILRVYKKVYWVCYDKTGSETLPFVGFWVVHIGLYHAIF